MRLRAEKLRISRLKHLHNLDLKIRASFILFNFKRVYNILATITPLTKDFTSNYLTKRLDVWNTPYVILSWSFQQSTKSVYGQWRSIIRIWTEGDKYKMVIYGNRNKGLVISTDFVFCPPQFADKPQDF